MFGAQDGGRWGVSNDFRPSECVPRVLSLSHCIECGDEIPEKRRAAVAGVKTCIHCQSGRDGRVVLSGINRRGSKDSQLR